MTARLLTKLWIEHMTKCKQIVPINITILTNTNKTTINYKNSSHNLSLQQAILHNFNGSKQILIMF